MSSWNVVVGPFGNGKFRVWLLDFNGIEVMAEDRGPDHSGYAMPELRETLADAYGLPAVAIDSLLYAAGHNGSDMALPDGTNATGQSGYEVPVAE